MPEHHVGAVTVRAVVLGEQARVGLHVVIEYQEELAAGGRGAAVARHGAAAVALLEHGQRKRHIECPQGTSGAVGGAVHHNDHLERTGVTLGRERPHRPDHDLHALVGRDHDAEPRRRCAALSPGVHDLAPARRRLPRSGTGAEPPRTVLPP